MTPNFREERFGLSINSSFHFVFSLRSVVDKPPIGGKELLPLTGHSLSGFRLNPGPVSLFQIHCIFLAT